jgi:hypothetical protein
MGFLAVMQLTAGPSPLPPPDGMKWIRRAPSWAEFRVASWGASLLVVSVHAKSGGASATVKDVEMIGAAVLALKAQRDAAAAADGADDADDAVLITGDFNLEPKKIAAALEQAVAGAAATAAAAGGQELAGGFELAFGDAEDCPPTNIFKFNGSGDVAGAKLKRNALFGMKVSFAAMRSAEKVCQDRLGTNVRN